MASIIEHRVLDASPIFTESPGIPRKFNLIQDEATITRVFFKAKSMASLTYRRKFLGLLRLTNVLHYLNNLLIKM